MRLLTPSETVDRPIETVAKTADVPAAKPALGPAVKADSGQVLAQAESAVKNWANAWANQDLRAYFKAYADEFIPAGKLSRTQWEKQRRGRIEGKSKISVRIEGLEIVLKGSAATATFNQHYQAKGLSESTRKTLELVQRGDSWKIVSERVGG